MEEPQLINRLQCFLSFSATPVPKRGFVLKEQLLKQILSSKTFRNSCIEKGSDDHEKL
jgi:hypothetical protein